jgi:superfamily I DNA and/or RNA helicase
MAWFMNLLELMVLSGGGKDLANPQGNIVFNQIKYDTLDLRLITFSNPSKTLSPSIDLFTDFKATFHYIDENDIKRNKQIKISGLSKKGHEVIAIPTNPSDLDSINLSGVKEVELTFVRVLDLISKLTTAFKSLDLEDDFNLKSELTENINFIFGPPGTGKTTEIAKQVINKIETGISKNILILTPTNKAADVIVKRILDLVDAELDPDGWLCRYGASTDLDLINRGMVYDGNTFKFHLFQKCVMATTIQRFPYEKVITNIYENGEEKTSISEIAWDTIIFDEASMIMLPAIIYPLYKRKFKRYDRQELTEFIIGGDPLQIPPIYDIADSDLGEDNEDVKEENIYTMIGLKSFDETVQAVIPKYGTKIKNLPIQYRSIEAIGTLFSKFQYNGVLSHGRNNNLGGSPNPRQLPDYFVNLGFKPITIIRYPVNSSDALFNPQKLNGSPLHLYSSFLINELILKFREETTEDWDIGVVAPYRSQATLLNKLIESHSDKSKLNIVTDTVHGFQGGECDLVFNVFNPSSIQSHKSYFLKKEFIFNVAISRARDYLIILIPDEDTIGLSSLNLIHEKHNNSLLSIIKDLPANSVSYLDASQIEKKIMGKKDFFQKNSFTNIHQTVNIYSDLYKDYMVKVSGNALDIHIKKQ